MKKYFIAIGLSILVILIAWIVFDKPNYIKPTAGENIIVFGDSLAFGQGSTTGNDLASLLSKTTGLTVINAGINGDTSISALPRLESDVLAKNPKVVIILLGGNDFFQRIEPEQTTNSIRTMIERIQITGAGVILVNENKIFATTSMFKKLAKEKQIPYIQHALGGIIGDNKLMYDQIHPNDAGYEILSEKIKPVLEDYLAN